MSLTIGQAAPTFSLPNDASSTTTLAQYAGRTLVLYFYPKDDTSGCTQEAKDFSELKAQFSALNTDIVGVSPDGVTSHCKFKTKYDLNLDLVSDEAKTMLEAYGVWVEKSMYGKKYMGVERTTVLINGQGIILNMWSKVKVPNHAQEVLNFIKNL